MAMESAKTVPCPVCGTACPNTPVRSFSVSQAADHFCPRRRSSDRHERLLHCVGRLWNGERADILRCPACSFGFSWPLVGGDEEFYSILHESAGYPSWRWEYDLTLRRVLSDARAGAILDFGTGDGSFLQRVDPTWKKYGTEGSETTRFRLREQGIVCFRDTVEARRELAGRLDVITMFQVLEHIAEFREVLRDCRALLRRGGVLVVSVPHGEATQDQEELTGCADMPPNHCLRWMPAPLGIAMRQEGLEPAPAVLEPGSWRLYGYRAWLALLARAIREPQSSASFAHSLRSRIPRYAALGVLFMGEVVRSLPQVRRMTRGRSFLMVGRRP